MPRFHRMAAINYIHSSLTYLCMELICSLTVHGLGNCVHALSPMLQALAAPDSLECGFFLAPWHDDAEAEAKIKTDTKATIRCFPLDQQHHANGRHCFYSGRPATHMALFARAF